ncbi:hypothetical protein [Microbispora bryophytorum]|nr:hypothetical protein [Microbispora camponoti]
MAGRPPRDWRYERVLARQAELGATRTEAYDALAGAAGAGP